MNKEITDNKKTLALKDLLEIIAVAFDQLSYLERDIFKARAESEELSNALRKGGGRKSALADDVSCTVSDVQCDADELRSSIEDAQRLTKEILDKERKDLAQRIPLL